MKNVALIVLLLFTNSVFAGVLGESVFIEPSIGFRTENMSLTDLSLNKTQVKMSAPNLGLKLSYRTRTGIELAIGGDFSTGKADVTGLSEKNNFTKTNTGFSIGVNSMGFVKMYLGASLSNEFVLKESALIQEVKFAGPSYQAGLSFKLLRWMSIGLQYNLNQYDKVTGQAYQLGSGLDAYFSKVDTQDYTGFLSFEF